MSPAPNNKQSTLIYRFKGLTVYITNGVTKDFPKDTPIDGLDTSDRKKIPGITVVFEETKTADGKDIDVAATAHASPIVELFQKKMGLHKISTSRVQSDDGYALFLVGQPIVSEEKHPCTSDTIFKHACAILDSIAAHEQKGSLSDAIAKVSKKVDKDIENFLDEKALVNKCERELADTLKKYAITEKLDHGSVDTIKTALKARVLAIRHEGYTRGTPLARIITDDIKQYWPKERCAQFDLDNPHSAKRKIFIGDLVDVVVNNLNLPHSARRV